MANRPSDFDSDIGVAPGRESFPGTPRWVKMFGAAALALVVLLLVIMATGHGGHHGLHRHMLPGGAGGPAPPAAGAERP